MRASGFFKGFFSLRVTGVRVLGFGSNTKGALVGLKWAIEGNLNSKKGFMV